MKVIFKNSNLVFQSPQGIDLYEKKQGYYIDSSSHAVTYVGATNESKYAVFVFDVQNCSKIRAIYEYASNQYSAFYSNIDLSGSSWLSNGLKIDGVNNGQVQEVPPGAKYYVASVLFNNVGGVDGFELQKVS